jgi:prepilin-type N-terminal cleavage/methylation domain-containing protein
MSLPANIFENRGGYTLIEVLLVVAIINIIAAIGIPLYESLTFSNGIDVTTNTLFEDLYQAEIFSRSEKYDSGWGVAINGQTITLYQGSSYASRVTANDYTYTMPTTTATNGLTEVDFSSLYGLPQSTGTFTLTSGTSSRTVTINSQGMVND